MYKVLLAFVIMLNGYQNVNCTFLDFMYNQLHELRGNLMTRLVDFSHYLKSNIMRDKGIPPVNRNVNKAMRMYRPKDLETQNVQLNMAHRRILDSHVVQTRDGYILTLHRLSTGIARQEKTGHRIVLLHHGLLGSSEDWLLLGPDKSLPYLLSDAGYDVWLANARGNCYSRGHVSVNTNFRQFWNFTWQEVGEYDLPAILHYIRNATNTTQGINYVGHSMGATALLALLSTEPKYNEYFRLAILLAPLAIMTHARGPMKVMAPMMANPAEALKSELLGTGEFMPTRQVPSCMAHKFCKKITMLCMNSLLFFSGSLLQEGSRDANFIARLLYHVPAGGSTNTILHYAQLIKNKKFHKFGEKDSLFNLKDVSTPVAIFSSTDDWLSNEIDNQMLLTSMANPVGHIIIRGKNISHTEFVWGFQADILIFYKILDLLGFSSDINKIL